MAIMGADIIIQIERRPVWLISSGEKALFHCCGNRSDIIPPSPMVGGHSGGVCSYPVAVVELCDGKVIEVAASSIKFSDGGNFGIYQWQEECNKSDET